MTKWLTAAVAMLALATTVLAQGDSVRVRGVVTGVKADAGSLVVNTNKNGAQDNVTFAVTADTSIKSGDDVVKLADIKVGDKVRVDYTEAAGKKTAAKVRVETDEKK